MNFSSLTFMLQLHNEFLNISKFLCVFYCCCLIFKYDHGYVILPNYNSNYPSVFIVLALFALRTFWFILEMCCQITSPNCPKSIKRIYDRVFIRAMKLLPIHHSTANVQVISPPQTSPHSLQQWTWRYFLPALPRNNDKILLLCFGKLRDWVISVHTQTKQSLFALGTKNIRGY